MEKLTFTLLNSFEVSERLIRTSKNCNCSNSNLPISAPHHAGNYTKLASSAIRELDETWRKIVTSNENPALDGAEVNLNVVASTCNQILYINLGLHVVIFTQK